MLSFDGAYLIAGVDSMTCEGHGESGGKLWTSSNNEGLNATPLRHGYTGVSATGVRAPPPVAQERRLFTSN